MIPVALVPQLAELPTPQCSEISVAAHCCIVLRLWVCLFLTTTHIRCRHIMSISRPPQVHICLLQTHWEGYIWSDIVMQFCFASGDLELACWSSYCDTRQSNVRYSVYQFITSFQHYNYLENYLLVTLIIIMINTGILLYKLYVLRFCSREFSGHEGKLHIFPN